MTDFVLWGLTASPFQLKMQAILDGAQCRWERWPEQASIIAGIRMAVRLQRAKKRRLVARYPAMSDLDEYPSVPFYTLDGRTFYYDSSSLAVHLDALDTEHISLVPEDPAEAFLCHLIDEAFDEFGLYMVHHMRWVGSARSTRMGDMTVAQLGGLRFTPFARRLARNLYARQVRRCPYLFSVAPEGFDVAMPPERTPPARDGFPPTHELLENSWRECLALVEGILRQQSFLLGERFTLADASVFGQLGMNLVDAEAAALMRQLAPRTHEWLCAIDRGEHSGSGGSLGETAQLRPLLQWIGETFVPLLVQNERAYESARAQGETLFNEAAFNRNRALYDGELRGHPYRAVVKTFQVEVWRGIRRRWAALSSEERDTLRCTLPESVCQQLAAAASA